MLDGKNIAIMLINKHISDKMNVNQLIEGWDSEAAGELSSESYSVRLPLDTAAKLEALATCSCKYYGDVCRSKNHIGIRK
ncbi:MAG: hypothetical protein P8X83_06960 [Nitrosopumilaceae archaeon]